MGEDRKRQNWVVKIDGNELRFVYYRRITDGFVLPLPWLPGVDFHFTFHSNEKGGIFHLKHKHKKVAGIDLDMFQSEVERFQRDPGLKDKFLQRLNDEWIYRPSHTGNIQVVAVFEGAEFVQEKDKKVVFDVDRLIGDISLWEIPAQGFRDFAAKLSGDPLVKILFAIDSHEHVLIIVLPLSEGKLIPLQFPYLPERSEKTMKELQRKILNLFILISPTYTEFLRKVSDFVNSLKEEDAY